MRLDRNGSVAGLVRDIARPLDLGVEEAAWGVHAAANANMERAMRIVSVERGRDPRRYAIVAFGGAGPVHAARLAKALGAPRVIVPFGAGVGSAIGLLRAVPKIEVSVTRVMAVEAGSIGAMHAIYDNLERRATADLERLGVAGEPVWSRSGYLRYRGQGYEIRAEFPCTSIGDDFAGVVAESFHAAYARSYGYRDDAATIEAVDWHLTATLPAGPLDSTSAGGRPRRARWHRPSAWRGFRKPRGLPPPQFTTGVISEPEPASRAPQSWRIRSPPSWCRRE